MTSLDNPYVAELEFYDYPNRMPSVVARVPRLKESPHRYKSGNICYLHPRCGTRAGTTSPSCLRASRSGSTNTTFTSKRANAWGLNLRTESAASGASTPTVNATDHTRLFARSAPLF